MVWLIGIGCLALGIILGAVFANRLGGSPARIKELENQVKGLEERHDLYKGDVSEHFNATADLVQQMTQSYRDVYQHLATGAQDLCSAEVANKLLPVGSDAVFDTANPREEALGFNPPKDYATKQNPDQKGALAEDFGLEKTKPEESSPYSAVAAPAPDDESRKVSEYRPEGEDDKTESEQSLDDNAEQATSEESDNIADTDSPVKPNTSAEATSDNSEPAVRHDEDSEETSAEPDEEKSEQSGSEDSDRDPDRDPDRKDDK